MVLKLLQMLVAEVLTSKAVAADLSAVLNRGNVPSVCERLAMVGRVVCTVALLVPRAARLVVRGMMPRANGLSTVAPPLAGAGCFAIRHGVVKVTLRAVTLLAEFAISRLLRSLYFHYGVVGFSQAGYLYKSKLTR